MNSNTRTAAEAFSQVTDSIRNCLLDVASAFVCPYPACRVYALHHWGKLEAVSVSVGRTTYSGRPLNNPSIYAALCAACGHEVIFVDSKMVKPATSEAPMPNEDMPQEIIDEYREAAAILPGSARGAAAMLRLAVQKLLPVLGATKHDINDQIGELVGRSIISTRVQEALDTLRVVGNEAVHPGTIDLRDNPEIAMGLFKLLNFIVEKAISEPKHAEEMFAGLPAGKQDAITLRNTRALANPSPANNTKNNV